MWALLHHCPVKSRRNRDLKSFSVLIPHQSKLNFSVKNNLDTYIWATNDLVLPEPLLTFGLFLFFSGLNPAGHHGQEEGHQEVLGWYLCLREDHCGGARS